MDDKRVGERLDTWHKNLGRIFCLSSCGKIPFLLRSHRWIPTPFRKERRKMNITRSITLSVAKSALLVHTAVGNICVLQILDGRTSFREPGRLDIDLAIAKGGTEFSPTLGRDKLSHPKKHATFPVVLDYDWKRELEHKSFIVERAVITDKHFNRIYNIIREMPLVNAEKPQVFPCPFHLGTAQRPPVAWLGVDKHRPVGLVDKRRLQISRRNVNVEPHTVNFKHVRRNISWPFRLFASLKR